MKKIIIYLFLMIFAFTLTGCRQVDKTANNFKGDIEIAWDDVKDDFNDIDQNIKKDTTYVSNIKGDDIEELTKQFKKVTIKLKVELLKTIKKKPKKSMKQHHVYNTLKKIPIKN